jgi:hypothetical protein
MDGDKLQDRIEKSHLPDPKAHLSKHPLREGIHIFSGFIAASREHIEMNETPIDIPDHGCLS